MRITRTFLVGALVLVTVLFWIATWLAPTDTRNAVTISYCLISFITAFIMVPDVFDILKTNGEGMRWQTILGKTGILLMTASFAAASGWSAMIGIKGFPTELVQSPLPIYFRVLQGIGLGALYWGLSDPESASPKFNNGLTTTLLVLGCGIVIGYALGHVPFLSTATD